MRGTTDLFLIDGQSIVVPDSNLKLQVKDLESSDSGLDESAFLHRFVARQGVSKWTFSYGEITAEEYAYMEGLFAGKDTFVFTRPSLADSTVPVASKCYRSKHQTQWRNAVTGQFGKYQFNITEC